MKRVLVGMSGGVDSSVAAYLLKQQGYEVIGATLSLIPKENDPSINDAKKVCQELNIEHYVLNYQDYFKNTIIKNFIESYQNGITPNPCVLCNKMIKFGVLWEKAQELNCDFIATGHYAKVENGKIHRIDSPKDQSYFLYNINKEVLPHIIFPLSNYPDKEEIRAIATKNNLITAHKKDSQDICFIENGKYIDFLKQYLKTPMQEGNFIYHNQVIGRHKGLFSYTIGQRKGLAISHETPLYVITINSKNNEVILGDENELYSNTITITNTNFLVSDLPPNCLGKIRYKSPLIPCQIEKIDDNNLKVIFSEPVKSATPGQSLVLYEDDILLGGGVITI